MAVQLASRSGEAATMSAEQPQSDGEADMPMTAMSELVRVLVQSFIATQPRRRGEAFIAHALETFRQEGSVCLLRPARSRGRRSSDAEAHDGAEALFSRFLPVLYASLPER
jgi:hypothetical protein